MNNNITYCCMKILTGTKESGARRIVNQLLKANGIDKTNATLIDQDLPADAAPLFDGRADVAITIAPPDSDKMQEAGARRRASD